MIERRLRAVNRALTIGNNPYFRYSTVFAFVLISEFGFGSNITNTQTIRIPKKSRKRIGEINRIREKLRLNELILDSAYGLDSAKIESYANENEIKVSIIENRFELEDTEEIAIYLLGNIMIVRCLQSDAYISKPVREKILNEMLMPRSEEE